MAEICLACHGLASHDEGCPYSDTVEISIAEYEALQQDSRRVAALRNLMDEFSMRRKLIRGTREYDNAIGKLRRVTLNGISVRLAKDWNG